MSKTTDPLLLYKQKRDFTLTPEPEAGAVKKTAALSFVVQKHAARALHYDLRLELDGTLKSWAVPKGPSLDPAQKRLAVHVEDHPLAYAGFEGVIPAGQYGAGTVIVWDNGTWEPLGDPRGGLASGQLKFRLMGHKLRGAWALVRMKGKPGDRQEAWLLIKERDAAVRPESEYSIVKALPDSVLNRPQPEFPAGAKSGPMPPALAPQLATPSDAVPAEDGWDYEVKFDGYRILARIDSDGVALMTRNGHDWTVRLQNLAAAIKELNLASGWLDGELVMPGPDGVPDFGALQNALESGHDAKLQYFIFDIPFYNGYDLRDASLADRRDFLARLLPDSPAGPLRFSQSFAASGADLLHSACRLGLEGIIGKRKDSSYVSGRSRSWLKIKCARRQEFVVVGYTAAQNSSRDIGALLLAVYDDAGKLRYAGRVGTGFNARNSGGLQEKLVALAVAGTPLAGKPKAAQGNWVAPELVAEVSFAEWTKEGLVRHAVFHGLRSDKAATSVIREAAAGDAAAAGGDEPGAGPRRTEAPVASVKISHPDRIIDAGTGATKLDLVNYYRQAAEWMLPHLVNRPVALVRAPEGIAGQHFFQKHGGTLRIPGLRRLDQALDPGHPALLEIDSAEALIGAVQMNVVEFHTWNATTNHIEKPDRMVFDLDPGEGLAWPLLLEAAALTRTLLDELGLQSYLKTSGGNGLHVVVPLTPRDDWETVKDFSAAAVRHLAKVIPSLFVVKSGPRNRVGKVFVDYLRNGRGATTAAAFTARARPGLGVSLPCSWQELATLTGGAHWTVANALTRLETGGDAWADYAATRQTLRGAGKKLMGSK